jgi:hypothetical protein
MTSWIITAVLAALIGWIIFVEVKYGRRSKEFLAKTNEEINALGRTATIAYRAKFGRDPPAPFIRVDEKDDGKVSSKES